MHASLLSWKYVQLKAAEYCPSEKGLGYFRSMIYLTQCRNPKTFFLGKYWSLHSNKWTVSESHEWFRVISRGPCDKFYGMEGKEWWYMIWDALYLSLGCLKNNTVWVSYSKTVRTWVYRNSKTFVKQYMNLGPHSSSIYQWCNLETMPSPLWDTFLLLQTYDNNLCFQEWWF